MKTKVTLAIFIFMLAAINCIAQDGSDMRYISPKKLNKSFIGQFAHIDFYNNSHFGLKLDTISISIGEKPIKFIEHRVDDGFNSWFAEQYLYSLDTLEGCFIKIVKCKIDSIKTDSILVTNYLEFYDANNLEIVKKTQQQKDWFKKGIIFMVLIKSKQL